jgi:hypothetical protein
MAGTHCARDRAADELYRPRHIGKKRPEIVHEAALVAAIAVRPQGDGRGT